MKTHTGTVLEGQNSIELTTNKESWLEKANSQRLIYLLKMFFIHGCITIPLAFLSMNLNGSSDFQFLLIALTTVAIVSTNLAALSVKVTILTFVICTGSIVIMMISNLIWYFV